MTASLDLPDISRDDVDVVVVNQWTLDSPERRRAVVETITAEWDHREWPGGLVSFNCFVGSGDERVLTYAQWAGDGAKQEFMRSHRPHGVRALENAVPGIETSAPVTYRLYRSFIPRGEARIPGCIVVVNIEATGADLARRWVDTVLDALRAEGDPRSALISAHFHISTDGTKILNYAEWTDERAHREAMEDKTSGGIAQVDSPEWRRVQNMPGVKPAGLSYFRLHQSLSKRPR